MVRVEVHGSVLAWARERAGLTLDDLRRRFPKLGEWESGTASPTFRQLDDFAHATHTPVGFLFLQQPPVVELPLPDFRTRGNLSIREPSPDLLDTIFQSQQRQEWYEKYARANGTGPLPFVGALTTAEDIVMAAARMRQELNYDVGNRGSSWSEAFRLLADHAEELGVLVMVNGVVGTNTRRKLNPEEFQGFALVNHYAPVVFVNGADTRAAQIFTLAHELAHVWIGQSALDDPDPSALPGERTERWCSQVAAELLVPRDDLSTRYREEADLSAQLDRLARIYKVSTLVVLRRARDLRYLSSDKYQDAYRAELEKAREAMAASTAGGGNFYSTQPARTSKRFARAIISDTLEGQTLYRDAFQLLGFRKLSTFQEMARQLGVV